MINVVRLNPSLAAAPFGPQSFLSPPKGEEKNRPSFRPLRLHGESREIVRGEDGDLLIPMLAVTRIDAVELENEDGSIDRLDITALTRPNSCRKIVGLESKLKIHGEASYH